MHIPDGWVDPIFLLITWIFTILLLVIALHKMRDIDETRITYMAVLGGTIFAAQMLNFPILGGTSGHLLGGALAASIVGPWGGLLVITVVLIIQALLFADGGLIALGANIFNMGFVGVFIAYFIIRHLMLNVKPDEHRSRYYAGIFIGAFFSVVAASFFAAIEIGIAIMNNMPAIPFLRAIPIILFYHIIIGIGEGIITTCIVLYFNNIEMNVFLDFESPILEVHSLRK